MPAGPVSSTEMFAGTVMAGAMVSRTVTVNDPDGHVRWHRPWPSTTPSSSRAGTSLPDAGEQVGVTAPLTASSADAA